MRGFVEGEITDSDAGHSAPYRMRGAIPTKLRCSDPEDLQDTDEYDSDPYTYLLHEQDQGLGRRDAHGQFAHELETMDEPTGRRQSNAEPQPTVREALKRSAFERCDDSSRMKQHDGRRVSNQDRQLSSGAVCRTATSGRNTTTLHGKLAKGQTLDRHIHSHLTAAARDKFQGMNTLSRS